MAKLTNSSVKQERDGALKKKLTKKVKKGVQPNGSSNIKKVKQLSKTGKPTKRQSLEALSSPATKKKTKNNASKNVESNSDEEEEENVESNGEEESCEEEEEDVAKEESDSEEEVAKEESDSEEEVAKEESDSEEEVAKEDSDSEEEVAKEDSDSEEEVAKEESDSEEEEKKPASKKRARDNEAAENGNRKKMVKSDKVPNDSETASCELFVRGIRDLSEEDLYDYFKEFGTTKVRVATDRETGMSRGFAFVTYETPADAKAALSNGTDCNINGQSFTVRIAEPKTQFNKPSHSQNDNAESCKLFAGGIGDLSEQDLTNYFNKFGNTEEVHVAINRETGMPRGFGFITYETPAEAKSALSKGLECNINGQSFNIRIADSNRGGGGRGGRGGRGGGFGGRGGGGRGGGFGGGRGRGSGGRGRGGGRSYD